MPASFQKIGGFIVRCFNEKRGYAWPTVARIAFECSCSEATVYRAFQACDGPLRDWFTVGKVIIDGEERNTY
ncbi:helix-turn-helix domain-containing protein, partial [Klebsiella pneumoniae]|uniref:helix-turn-helix domain-containing protein n=1 Tax=Klebsiella pneumoniae TaxID=573 RepID=UPI0038526D82